MESDRLTRYVFLCDIHSCKRGTWSYGIKHVFADIDKIGLYNNRENFDLEDKPQHAETV